MSIGSFGDLTVEPVSVGGERIGVAVRWTNGQYSLACFGSNAETRSSRTCVKRTYERVTQDTFYPGNTEHVDGTVSVTGCVTEVACDLCEGSDYCDGRAPISFGSAYVEEVSRYAARTGRLGRFPPLSPRFRTTYLPVDGLGIP